MIIVLRRIYEDVVFIMVNNVVLSCMMKCNI